MDWLDSKKLAFIISRILGPLPLLCLLWFVVAIKSGVGFWKALWVYPLILFVSLAIPISITTFLIIAKQVSGFDWKNLSERKKFIPPIAAFAIISLVVQTYFFTNKTIFHLSLLLSAIILTMIFFWTFLNRKVSGHMTIAVITFAGINLFLQLKFLWLFLLLIPIFWARITLNVHTKRQLIAGLIIPLIYIASAVLFFGWPKVT